MTERPLSSYDLTGIKLSEHINEYHGGFDPHLSVGAENIGDYLRMLYHEARHKHGVAGWPPHGHHRPTRRSQQQKPNK